ncbi:Protein kinase-like domain protein [Niveomyces insectorum RCEF 264]|uniref:non-specific serine/threonine protein kinase n=1 Tax=Niveomyces insectorum RCEF 264 TaxID=1081102 RepID=A0A162J6K4_9HYPO|nr:Protein kinase-like domain protein [Niveomyces insectorum RCEF 264]
MDDLPQSTIIKENPIGNGLDAFRASFALICEGADVSCVPDALELLGHDGKTERKDRAASSECVVPSDHRADLQNLALDLVTTLQSLRVSRLLRSSSGGKGLFGDLSRLNSAVYSDDFDLDRIKPVLKSVIADDPDDAAIWAEVYKAVTECTPPPRPIASSLQQTPWLHNTSSFPNSAEYRKDVDRVLRNELGVLYVGLPRFHETFFGRVSGLEAASGAVFKKCMEGSEPLFSNGWSGWPPDANQDDVLSWFAVLNEKLATLAEEYRSTPTHRRRPLAQPNQPIQGSTAERKLDVGFVDDPKAGKDSRCHWSHILVPGELKSNPSADKAAKAWLDLGTYAREVLAAQDTRRFVLGFTICGSLMRIWEFDRLGGIASEQFDINKDGLQFVSTVLGFLWMSEEELGFDPTIMTAHDERFIQIERNGATERLIIDEVMQRARCIAGRATTCWKAHREGHPQIPLVIKDSWQYLEREEEGELLRETTGQGVVNVARYYHHETVRIHNIEDDIRSNVRGGLDITTATTYRAEHLIPPRNTVTAGTSRRTGRSSSSAAGNKRSSSQISAALPPRKRSRLAAPTKAGRNTIPNRVHRRVVLCDYGKPIYKASSRSALLAAFDGCIEGHESLRHKAGLLHRDISINNLMINENNNNPSWPSFLIDLDLAVREQRGGASGAKGKTGTKAFMAIGALLGEQHSFMHDLESFFWVLFWICIHYNGPDESSWVVPRFENWSYVDTELLAEIKKGQVSHEGDFIRSIEEHFTPYYQPLIPWINRLRKVVFPNGGRWEREDTGLYARMREVLREAQRDAKVSAGHSLADFVTSKEG